MGQIAHFAGCYFERAAGTVVGFLPVLYGKEGYSRVLQVERFLPLYPFYFLFIKSIVNFKKVARKVRFSVIFFLAHSPVRQSE